MVGFLNFYGKLFWLIYYKMANLSTVFRTLDLAESAGDGYDPQGCYSPILGT